MEQGKYQRKTRKISTLSGSGMVKLRVMIMCFALIFAFAMVAVQCFILQIVRSEELVAKGMLQWNKYIVAPAERGRIADTNGIILARSVTSYKVLISPRDIPEADWDRVTDELCTLLSGYNRSRDYIYARVSNTAYETKRQSFELVRRIDAQTAARIELVGLGNGVSVEPDVSREYTGGSMLSQVLGYLDSDGRGIAGIEKKYDDILRGEDGKTAIEKTGTGARLALGDEQTIEPKTGNSITLTIDRNLQYFLENALKEALEVNDAKTAQGIILDAKTGAIRAISTKPDFDPNFRPTSAEELNDLSRNRVISDSYEPGSVFKIITLASALDSNTVDINYSIFCGGASIINNERIKCWRTQGHGSQTLTQCAENSCNVAFMDLALKMGNDTFYDYICKFGFGEVTSCGMPGEDAGIVTNKKYVRANDLARIGFGQSISVTPIQLATAVAAAVNGGNLMQPYVVESETTADGEVIEKTEPTVVRRVISEDTSSKVRRILESVVENGSGRNAKIAGYRIGGKTGTSQKAVNGEMSSSKLIASFVGIAPIDDPRYVCLILVDEPNVDTIFGSTVAAPFVKQVLEQTLEYAGYERKTDEETVEVPNVTGMYVRDAEKVLSARGLSGESQVRGEKITKQIPEAGTKVPKGTPILLYTLSTGAVEIVEKVEVPKLVGLTKYEAYTALEALGLKLEVVTEYDGGKVTAQYPYYGDKVEVGSTVQVKFED